MFPHNSHKLRKQLMSWTIFTHSSFYSNQKLMILLANLQKANLLNHFMIKNLLFNA